MISSEVGRLKCRFVRVACALSIFILALLSNLAYAQSTVSSTALSVNGDNMTPTPGGHDYIHFFGETVSPSNGSVSYRLNYPMPKGRGLSYPYWYGYTTAGQYQLMYLSPEATLNWIPNPLNFNGSTPYITFQESQLPQTKYQCGPLPSNQCQLWPCNYATGFTFVGLDGVSHNVGLLAAAPSQGPPPPTWTGGANPCGNGYVNAGGDGEVSAQFTDPSSSTGTINTVQNWSICNQCIPVVQTGGVGSYTITDKDGTTYFFGGGAVYNSSAQVWIQMPSKIEDRNGNEISGNLDTLNRQVASSASTIGGIQYPTSTPPAGAPAGVTINYPVAHDKAVSTDYQEPIQCPWITGDFVGNISGSTAAWTGVALPDGTQYGLYFGTYNPTDSTVANNFGLLNEVIFPGGGWIKYKWNIETNTANATSMAEYSGTGSNTGMVRNGACFLRYSVPTLSSRIVSYDGRTVAQTQSFTYTTVWPSNWINNAGDWLSKTTTVTTTDNVLGKTSKIVYNYVPGIPSGTNNAMGGGSAQEIPLESTIQYYDWGASTPLKVVHKAWFNMFEQACELTTINGMTSGHFYQYVGTSTSGTYPNDYVTDDQEFDYGLISDPTVCGTQATAGVAPTRETKTTYQTFQVPSGLVPYSANSTLIGAFFQKPKTVITYDGAGNRIAETDYAFDGGTLTDPGTVVAHDESYYPSTVTTRGNVTSITRQCFTANCTNATSQTTYAYDKAGQVVSRTAPCGNVSGGCSDIGNVSQTTTYSYSDSPANGNAPGPSDAYVSKITSPATGSTTHQVSFSYNYALGDLVSSTDENGQQTAYTYECSSAPCSALDRLTKSAFADGGQTTLTYNDWTSVTTSQLIAASKTAKTSVAFMDGMFRPVQTQVTSDPEGTDYTDTTLDAEGHTIAVSNPHRAGSSTTDGNTQTIADVLGRPLKITKQDTSIVTTLYNDPCFIMTKAYGVTVTDEAGNHRRSCTDGLGRLVEVDEPGAGNGPLVPGSGTVYVSGGTQAPVTINPCANNPPPQPNSCPQTIYNNGTTTVTVNGVMVSASWSGNPSFVIQNLVTELVNALNGTGTVSATPSGNSIIVTALQGGSNTNYSISTSTTWNTQYFSTASYSASLSGGTLTGGSGYAFYSTNAFITLYNYDLLGNLLCVWQRGSDTTVPPAFSYSVSSNTSNCLTAVPAAWRPRSFTYDSLSRLVTATNPESGTVSYSYDVNGNLTSKTAPQPNQLSTATETTNYTYDSLNRLLKKTYTGMSSPATATVTYGYDGIAATGCTPPSLTDSNPKPLRTSMCDGAGASSWAHDKMGRIVTEKRTTAGVTKSTGYTYNLDGSVASITYPSGRVLNYDYFGSNSTSAGRLINLKDSGGTNYVTNVKYAPPGEATSYTNGTSITNTNFYGARLQPWFLTAYTATAPIMELCYDFHSAQAVSATADGTTCSFAASTAGDNGNINQIVNERNTNRSQNFTYDSLNRIQQAWTTGTNWGETFTIDAWGNLTNKGPVGGKTSYESLNAAPANNKNQLNGYCHDSSGNLILNAGCPTGSFVATYSYDAENRMVSNPGATYVYDGDGNRVKKVGSITTIYWYGATGDILTETDSSGGTVNDYVFFNGKRVARRDATTVRYYFSDHLGSTSLITDANGTMAPEAESDYYPYGGEIVITADSSNNHYKFTGKERDAETCGTMCLDNFGARYDTSSLGRFMTADSASYSNHKNPQSWNLYAYAVNNPVTFSDSDGHEIVCANDFEQCKKDAAAATGSAEAAKRVTLKTTTEQHKFLGLKWSTSKTTIAITGDVKSFRALGQNASRLADLVADKQSVTVSYDQYAKPSFWANGQKLNGGATSYTPHEGYDAQAFIDPDRAAGVTYDQDAVDQHIPQSNTAEEFGHEVLGHIWGELNGGHLAWTKGNMRDAMTGEDAVRKLDPSRGQKGIESHHNYNEMPD